MLHALATAALLALTSAQADDAAIASLEALLGRTSFARRVEQLEAEVGRLRGDGAGDELCSPAEALARAPVEGAALLESGAAALERLVDELFAQYAVGSGRMALSKYERFQMLQVTQGCR